MSLVEFPRVRTRPGSPSTPRQTDGGPGRMVLFVAVILLVATGLAGCGGDDDDAVPSALPSRLPDPCRLISTAQLRQELGVEFSTRPAGDDPPAEEEITEVSCSWVSLDPEREPSGDYLDEDVPAFIDVVVRRDGGSFDATEMMEEAAADPDAVKVRELVATEADPTLADAATAVGSTLFVLKGDVMLTVSTESPDSLNGLIAGIIERIVRRI